MVPLTVVLLLPLVLVHLLLDLRANREPCNLQGPKPRPEGAKTRSGAASPRAQHRELPASALPIQSSLGPAASDNILDQDCRLHPRPTVRANLPSNPQRLIPSSSLGLGLPNSIAHDLGSASSDGQQKAPPSTRIGQRLPSAL